MHGAGLICVNIYILSKYYMITYPLVAHLKMAE